jgi:hypothetical protein
MQRNIQAAIAEAHTQTGERGAFLSSPKPSGLRLSPSACLLAAACPFASAAVDCIVCAVFDAHAERELRELTAERARLKLIVDTQVRRPLCPLDMACLLLCRL